MPLKLILGNTLALEVALLIWMMSTATAVRQHSLTASIPRTTTAAILRTLGLFALRAVPLKEKCGSLAENTAMRDA